MLYTLNVVQLNVPAHIARIIPRILKYFFIPTTLQVITDLLDIWKKIETIVDFIIKVVKY